MKPFRGFPTDRERLVSLPETFFTEVLPFITHPLELKVLLYVFWKVSKTQRRPRCVSLSEVLEDVSMTRPLIHLGGASTPKEALLRGLEMCAVRGTLLTFSTQTSEGEEKWFMVNTYFNRRWLRRVLKGEIQFPWVSEAQGAVTVLRDEESIFDVYEKNIGLLSPIVAEELEQALEEYSEEWVRKAISEAAGYNRRNWRFVRLLLERWKEQGYPGGANRQTIAGSLDADKYKRGKYSKFFGG